MERRNSRGVQQQDVDAAADELLDICLLPTIERVREKLGHGSPNTISPMLETWFAGLAVRLGVPPADAPQDATRPAVVRRLADQLWDSALEMGAQQARQALDEHRQVVLREQEAIAAEPASLQGERLEVAQREATLRERLAAA